MIKKTAGILALLGLLSAPTAFADQDFIGSGIDGPPVSVPISAPGFIGPGINGMPMMPPDGAMLFGPRV